MVGGGLRRRLLLDDEAYRIFAHANVQERPNETLRDGSHHFPRPPAGKARASTLTLKIPRR